MKRVVKKPEERRRDILRAARALFQTNDYEKTTMNEVMDTLNIAKGTIYHYFASKEDLLQAVIEDLIQEELEKKQALLANPGFQAMTALEKMRALIASSDIAEENAALLNHLHSSGNTTFHARQLGQYLIDLAPIFAAVIQDGCDEGTFSTSHPLECAEYLLAGLQFLTDTGFYPWSAEQLTRRISAFPSLMETQLGAPAGSFRFLAE